MERGPPLGHGGGRKLNQHKGRNTPLLHPPDVKASPERLVDVSQGQTEGEGVTLIVWEVESLIGVFFFE